MKNGSLDQEIPDVKTDCKLPNVYLGIHRYWGGDYYPAKVDSTRRIFKIKWKSIFKTAIEPPVEDKLVSVLPNLWTDQKDVRP